MASQTFTRSHLEDLAIATLNKNGQDISERKLLDGSEIRIIEATEAMVRFKAAPQSVDVEATGNVANKAKWQYKKQS